MNGPGHYQKAEEILAELDARPDIIREAEASMSTRALAHAMLANAAAVALSNWGDETRYWREAAGPTSG
jgi:hypothetical protein